MGKRKRGRKFWEKYQDLKNWEWGKISSFRELYTPLPDAEEPALVRDPGVLIHLVVNGHVDPDN